jgi:hypothetical protein
MLSPAAAPTMPPITAPAAMPTGPPTAPTVGARSPHPRPRRTCTDGMVFLDVRHVSLLKICAALCNVPIRESPDVARAKLMLAERYSDELFTELVLQREQISRRRDRR